MTHEELRDKIDNYDCAGMVDVSVVKALRAVVELHKPDDYCCHVCGPSLDVCGDSYPCPTIQAIEKELK